MERRADGGAAATRAGEFENLHSLHYFPLERVSEMTEASAPQPNPYVGPGFYALPERAQLAGAALRLPSEQWAVEGRRHDGLMNILGGAGNVQERPPPPLVAAIDQHLLQLAEAIEAYQQYATARHPRRGRGASVPPPAPHPSAPPLPPTPADYFASDRVDDEDEEALLQGLDPRRVPMYREVATLAEEQLNAEARARRLLNGTQVVRPAPAEVLQRFYFSDFRWPACKGQRKCRRGKGCLFRVGDRNKGYVGRAFYVGRTPPPDDVPLYCIDCLLLEMETWAQLNAKEDVVPLFSRQLFSVAVSGPGAYARADCIEIKLDERPTGLTGFVPRYVATQREYVEIPADLLEYYRKNGGGKAMARGYYRAECGVGFREASISAMDA
jgi:hypothetical protein